MTLISATEKAWPVAAAGLADQLVALGKLTDATWHAAVSAVPRHRLVPRYWIQDATGDWRETDTTAPAEQWMGRVYSNAVLISALHRDGDRTDVLSSSTQPGLMVRMLEALEIDDGHRVLEIGTGTGYNAALVSHRLGSEHVFTLDVEAELVDTARVRLAELGYTPTLQTGDGALGMAEHAPFDRIIATCAVPAVPWAWVEQLTADGQLLTDLKIAHGAGSLVKLHRTGPDSAEGRFEPVYAAFMDLRPDAKPSAPTRLPPGEATDRRTTTVDPRTPWSSLVVWFLAAFDLGPDVSIGYTGTDTTRPPAAVRISTPDGSWAEITLDHPDTPPDESEQTVTEGGPRALWRLVENAHHLWERHGKPDWARFGLTATPQRQSIWLDDPATGPRWNLPTAP